MSSILLCLCFTLLAVKVIASDVLALNESVYSAPTFSLSDANTNVWLSAAAYCGADKIEAHKFKGPTSGFVVTYVINDRKDTQGSRIDNALILSY